jgi:hypothetical protein
MIFSAIFAISAVNYYDIISMSYAIFSDATQEAEL